MKKHTEIIIVVFVFFILMSFLSILRYTSYNAAILDLGYMSQAIWSATKGDMLLVSYPQGILSRFTGHSEVIYFLIAQIYRFFPDPKTLLVVQALFYAVGALPLYLLTFDLLEEKKYAIWMSLVYLLYPVAMTSVLFDFHGDTLAMPLFFFAFYYLEKKKLIPFTIIVLLILSCKIYLFLPVLVYGIVLIIAKNYKGGLIAVVLAIVWYLAVNVIRNEIIGGGVVENAGGQVAGYASDYFSNVLYVIWEDIDFRILNGLIVFLPIIFLGLRSPLWLIPGVGLAGGVLLSSGPGPGYDYRFHHYAVAIPFFILAILKGAKEASSDTSSNIGLGRIFQFWTWKASLKATFFITVVMNILLVQTPFSPLFYIMPYQGSTEIPVYSYDNRDKLKDSIIDNIIPPDKGVLTDIFLAPHMANRSFVYATHYTDTGDDGSLSNTQFERILTEVDYVFIDLNSVYYDPGSLDHIQKHDDFYIINDTDGLVVFSKEKGGLPNSDYNILDSEDQQ